MDKTKLDLGIKDWYTGVYPHDMLGKQIKPDITFHGLMKTINRKQNVYTFLGVLDSTVRARCFMKLSDLTGVGYERIFNKWLSAAKK